MVGPLDEPLIYRKGIISPGEYAYMNADVKLRDITKACQKFYQF